METQAVIAHEHGSPVAVIDIGSNSVRLVVYATLARNLVEIFNEKNLCGLGRQVQTSGQLAADAVEEALSALRRFRTLCRVMEVAHIEAIATAACRDAANGPDFIAQARQICGVDVEVLSGPREAELSARGVASGVHNPDGIVGDLGGGSLELVDIKGCRIAEGVTLRLGGLALQDLALNSFKRAERIVREELAKVPQLEALRDRSFYAVGGSWRALARLHITQSGYPLQVIHGYAIPAFEALEFVRDLRRQASATILANVKLVTEARRPLLAYAALVLEHIIRIGQPSSVMFSTFGVREGLLHERLAPDEQTRDGLICAANELSQQLSRSAPQTRELMAWTDRLFDVAGIAETSDERRLRHVACLLSDIGWRVHPDHRGEQTFNMIANGNFGAISHAGRIFVALCAFYRHTGLSDAKAPPPALRQLLSPELLERARLIAAAFRLAQLISASHPGVLPTTDFRCDERKLTLVLEPRLGELVTDRLSGRLKQLARQIGRSPATSLS
ncbi:MAG: Ppx/GppA family phosphatase [Alphaproteobacteria bacterium]|nr:Ppx/GppA family phosphatase [Alphaproteobacteria bacterium]